jgi:serine protease Do
MISLHRQRPWIWLLVVLALAAGAGGLLAPRLGLTRSTAEPLWTDQPAAGTAATSSRSPDWVTLAQALKPAVVNVSTTRTPPATPALPQGPRGRDPFEEFFRHFFDDQPQGEVRSLGSGFVLNSNGDIVTNNHVVDGATEIRVKLSDGRELPAKIIGRDPKTDLALLKIEATGLPVIPLGNSAELRVGEPVMAIGNPFGLEQTVTTGIVSATGRVIGEGPYDDFIQTDASINPGNSGGPLINARGQAVGINTAIFSRSGGSVGIGFAIPVNLAKSVVTQLAETGHVVRGWLGVTIQPLTPELATSFGLSDTRGALVSSVVEGSPAMKAGVKPGDVITAYDGRLVSRSEDLPRAVADTRIGREVSVTLVRQATPLTLAVKVGRLDEPTQEAAVAPTGQSRLGLALEALTPARARELGLAETRGVLVQDVEKGGRAAHAGIQPGDVIVEVDHREVETPGQVRQLVTRHPAGPPLLLLVHRNGESLYVAVAA